jgi:hypothetical protein
MRDRTLASPLPYVARVEEEGMDAPKLAQRDLELLVLRALSGDRVPMLLGGRRYTLSVDPLFRLSNDSDGFLFLCLGLSSLRARVDRLSESLAGASPEKIAKLGGAQESH